MCGKRRALRGGENMNLLVSELRNGNIPGVNSRLFCAEKVCPCVAVEGSLALV